MKEKAIKRYPPIVEIVLLFCILMSVALWTIAPKDELSAPRPGGHVVEGVGYLTVDDDEPIEVDLKKGVEVLKPVRKTSVRFIIPQEVADSGTLAFRTTQAAVEVYMDGKLAYSYLMDNVEPNEVVSSMPFYHMLDMDRSDAGKEIEIIEHFPRSRFFGNWGIYTYGRGAELECSLYTDQHEGLLFALLLFTLSVFSMVLALFSREKDKKHAHFATSVVNFVFMLWFLTQSHSNPIILHNPLLSGYLMLIAIFLLPSSLLGFLFTHYELSTDSKAVKSLFYITDTFLLGLPVLAVLDWLGIVCMINLLVPISVICMLINIYILISAIVFNRKGIKMGAFILALSLVLASFLLEELCLVLQINLKSPFFLHLLMFLGSLLLFAKSLVVLFSDNMELGYKTKLRAEIMVDPLTGVLSRDAYEDFIASFNHEYSKEPAFVFVIDANGLKTINDSQGHAMGDTLLKSIAESLQRVFDGGKVFRIGGDEFLVYIENSGDHDIKSYSTLFKEVLDERFTNAASIGGAVYDPGVRMDIHEVIHNADLRMYSAKPPRRERK